jgi:large subunit ribosomal protein L32e
MVRIGFGSNKKTRGLLPNGFKKFLVKNVADLELLLMQNRKYCAEVASGVSSAKRREIVARAEQLNIRVTNANARLREEENE